MIPSVKDVPGLDSARALIVGLEVTSVAFVRNWVELLLDDEVRFAMFTVRAGCGRTFLGDTRPISGRC